MNANWVGALLAFAAGAGIATLNYLLSKYMLKKYPAQYAWTSIIRQILQVLYLVLLFAFGNRTPWDRIWLLLGGALGITGPMFCFTARLLRLADQNRKEESKDG